MISYTVTCTFKDEAVAEEWIEWLRDEHLAEVRTAGALDAEVVRFDSVQGADESGLRVEVRYHFASRESFARYERDHAPQLRAKGLLRFSHERGLSYERRVGETVVRA